MTFNVPLLAAQDECVELQLPQSTHADLVYVWVTQDQRPAAVATSHRKGVICRGFANFAADAVVSFLRWLGGAVA